VIEGFWAQLSASAVLVLCGLLLAAEGREPAGEGGTDRPRPSGRRRLRLPRRRRSDVGAVAPRWGAEQ
jgi:hypothetical protein